MLSILKLKKVLLGQYYLGAINNSCFYDDSRKILPVMESLEQANYKRTTKEYTRNIGTRRSYNRHRGVK